MKKNCFYLGIILSVFLLISCQKDTGDLPIQTANKVKTYTEDVTATSVGHLVVTYNLNYDADDRITSMVSASNPGDKIVYTYPKSNTVVTEIYVGGTLGIHYEGYYSNNSIDSSFQYNDTEDSSTEKFIYNSSGYLTKLYEYTYSKVTGSLLDNTINYTNDANGNQLKAEGTDTNSETFEYYDDKIYLHPLIGPALIPSVKRNLIKSHTLTSNGYHLGTGTLTYAFDSSDRIATITETIDDGSVVIKTFTYF